MMKKFLSFGLLALVLGMAPVAQSATLYNWTYTFSQDILTYDASGSQGTGELFKNVNVHSGTLTPNEFGGYNGADIVTSHGSYNQSSYVTTYMTFSNNAGKVVEFQLETGLTAHLAHAGFLVMPMLGFADSIEFELDGMNYQFGFRDYYPSSDFIDLSADGLEMYGTEDGVALYFDAFIESWPAEGPQPTPEPATMLLMGAGLAGLGIIKRRRAK